MRLIMNPGHEYVIYGKKVRAGDEFDVPENEAQTWLKLSRASRASPRGGVVDRGEQSAPVPEGASSQRVESPRSKRGRYNRSDMRAEEE